MSIARCAIHESYETFITGVSYRMCHECGHVFQKEQELLDLDYETGMAFWATLNGSGGQEPFKRTNGQDVPFCPLCMHDWCD